MVALCSLLGVLVGLLIRAGGRLNSGLFKECDRENVIKFFYLVLRLAFLRHFPAVVILGAFDRHGAMCRPCSRSYSMAAIAMAVPCFLGLLLQAQNGPSVVAFVSIET